MCLVLLTEQHFHGHPPSEPLLTLPEDAKTAIAPLVHAVIGTPSLYDALGKGPEIGVYAKHIIYGSFTPFLWGLLRLSSAQAVQLSSAHGPR